MGRAGRRGPRGRRVREDWRAGRGDAAALGPQSGGGPTRPAVRRRHDIAGPAGLQPAAGDPARGHLGYFLYPESSTLTHEEGTVGFVLTDDPETPSASCRFYICLTPTPIFDKRITAFGRVSRGMDVIKAIADRPKKSATQ